MILETHEKLPSYTKLTKNKTRTRYTVAQSSNYIYTVNGSEYRHIVSRQNHKKSTAAAVIIQLSTASVFFMGLVMYHPHTSTTLDCRKSKYAGQTLETSILRHCKPYISLY